MKLFFTSTILLFALTLMGQKVKEKGDIVFVDDSAFVKKECKKVLHDPCAFTTADGKQPLFVIVPYAYSKSIQVREGNTWVEKSLPAYYYMVQFSLVNKDFITLRDPKDLLKEMYLSGFILPNGSLDPDRMDKFLKANTDQAPGPGNSSPDLLNNTRW